MLVTSDIMRDLHDTASYSANANDEAAPAAAPTGAPAICSFRESESEPESSHRVLLLRKRPTATRITVAPFDLGLATAEKLRLLGEWAGYVR